MPNKSTATIAPPRLGDLLLRYKLISQPQLDAALQEQKTTKKRLGAILIDQGLVAEDAVNYVLGEQLNLPYVQITPDMVDPAVIPLIPQELLEKYLAVPLLKVNDELTMVMVDPTDQEAITMFVVQTGCKIKLAIGLSSAIKNVIAEVFKTPVVKLRRPKSAVEAFEFEQREVFQAALELADQVLKITEPFPAELQRSLGDDMREENLSLLKLVAQNDVQAAQEQIRKCIPMLLLAAKNQLIEDSRYSELRNKYLKIYNQLNE
jgi:type IV pilus assembly protein PilB